MKYRGPDWTGMCLGLASIYCLGHRNRIGFVLRIVAVVFWMAFCTIVGTVAGVLANFIAIDLCAGDLSAWPRVVCCAWPLAG